MCNGRLRQESQSSVPRSLGYRDSPILDACDVLSIITIRSCELRRQSGTTGGRKNWIHIGSPQAGPKVAAIMSVVETCRRLDIPVRAYLAAVLPGLAEVSIQKLAELTPAAWAARNR